MTSSPRHTRSGKRLWILLLIPILLLFSVSFTLFYFINSIELRPSDGYEGYRIWLRPGWNERRDDITKNLGAHLRSLAIQDNTARLQAGRGWKAVGNRLQDSAGNTITSELTLTRPGDAFSLGEYHGGTRFTVQDITADAVILSYTHTFSSYNGMGGQFVSQDAGEIILAPFGNP